MSRPALAAGVAGAVALLIVAARATAHTLDADSTALRAAIRDGHPPSAAEIDAVLARHPASADLEMVAGEVALTRHDPSALHHLGRAMRLQPSLPRPHELAAIELLRLRRPAQAAIEYRLAAERGQWFADGDLVRYLGRHALDAVPRTAVAYQELGRAYGALGRWDEASTAFDRAAELGTPSTLRAARLEAFAKAPPDRRALEIERLAREATDGDELALAVQALVALKKLDRADEVFTAGRTRFPTSARLVAEGARARAARGDLDGARALLTKTSKFDAQGRLLLGELAVELAQQAHDVEGASAAAARLRLLRAKADLEQPAGRK